jgi:hypothetical protein
VTLTATESGCTVVIVEADGVTVTVGTTGVTYWAVIVTLPETMTVQFEPDTDVHPDQEAKLFPPAVAGAPKMTVVPEASLTVNAVVPVVRRLVRLLP